MTPGSRPPLESAAPAEHAAPPRRVVLLGASNLTRGFSTVLPTAERIWGSPLEVFAALGHGRSYGQRSSVLGRTLGGILQCGLWDALAAAGPAPTAALLTDVGNDIVYGAPVPTILDWVEQCLDRLAATGARIVLTRLPMASIRQIPAWRYGLLRRCLFPGCVLSVDETVGHAEALDAGLAELAARRGIAAVEPVPDWYGFDPIHIRWRFMPAAWRNILAPWSDEPLAPWVARRHFGLWLSLRRLQPEVQTRFGIERHTPQPCGRFRGGTTIRLY